MVGEIGSSEEVSGTGGSLYYTCGTVTYNCYMNMDENNTFMSSYAENSGGAI